MVIALDYVVMLGLVAVGVTLTVLDVLSRGRSEHLFRFGAP